MTIRFITVTPQAQVLEVTNLFDRSGNDIKELWRAETCVVKFSELDWRDYDVEDVPIYTVH